MTIKDLFKKIAPKFLLSWYHYFLVFFGNLIYRFPSCQLKVVGVTGTKGKSTTIILAGKILEAAGFKVGWLCSATLKVAEKEWLNPYHMTMPGRWIIPKLLRKMVKAGCRYALIEVTSEGILQHRQQFINFQTAVLTNLAPEHIEAHGSFENYRAAKAKLFQKTKNTHILNLDDKQAEYFLQFPAKEKYLYQIKNGQAEIKITNRNSRTIEFLLPKLNLLGEFNLYNALAAISIAVSEGIDLQVCQKVLEKIKGIPGRMERIDEGQSFTVIVDLAHTPDSFEKVFQLAKNFPHQRIISVFGSAGGGRDKWKRPVLGKIAAQYSDEIILTNEDPYNEKPAQIISEIKSGIIETQFSLEHLYEVEDRREAIKKALTLAQTGDLVLILGKGTEQTLVIGDKKIPWDDRQVAREELRKLKNKI